MSTVRYFVMRNTEGVDCLRVEQDDPIVGITCVTTIPLYDLERAIAQYKADLYPFTSKRVRVTNDHARMPIGHFVQVQDAMTGESVEGVARAVITLYPDKLNLVELTFYDTDQPATSPAMKTMIVEDPDVDLSAFGNGRWPKWR